jgi:hypothetical protein
MHREKRDFDNYSVEAFVPNALFCSTAVPEAIGLVGFEPTASWSRTRRSTKLSHSPK